MRVAWLLVAVGCGGSTAPPDAPGPMAYQLYLFPAEPADRPTPAVAPTPYIDDVATRNLMVEYPSATAARGESHRAELRYGDVVVAAMNVTIGPLYCPGPIGEVLEYSQTLCAYDSGDLRFGGDTLRGAAGGCTGDSFCQPSCPCAAGHRCTAIVASMSPVASHLGCAPIGAKQLGDPCTFTPDLGGAYDDCSTDLICVAGTCHQTCAVGTTTCSCNYVAGYPPELGVCS